LRVRVTVFNATFNNISAISWLSVLVLDELVLEVAARHRDDVLAQPPDQDYNRSRIHTAYRHAAGLWFSPGTLVSFTNPVIRNPTFVE
jgi:hypothetical protein